MSALQDLTGRRFGRLLARQISETRRGGRISWDCLCDCGNSFVATAKSLKNGNTSSCGCFRREVTGKSRRTHGRSHDSMHSTWLAMNDRCCNPNTPTYAYYGGRGIKVCDRWRGTNGFLNFVADMGERPAEGMTLDRIDNDGGYEPGNVRWATRDEQASNNRRNRFVTYQGATKTLSQWARHFGFRPQIFIGRLRIGWDFERAALTPVGKRLS